MIVFVFALGTIIKRRGDTPCIINGIRVSLKSINQQRGRDCL
jgi:hypothetical protein